MSGFSYQLDSADETKNNRAKVRMLCTDVNPQDYTFSDAEIDAFIELAPSNLFAAAALAAETWARDQGRLSASLKSSDGTSTMRRTVDDLLKLAQSLRQASLRGGLQTGSINVGTPNEYLDSFRPGWRDLTETVVE